MTALKKPLIIRSKKSASEPTPPKINLVPTKEEVCELVQIKITDFLQHIVDFPEEVSISIEHGERTSIFRIDCSKRNFPKILGAKGKMISSIRTMVIAMTARHGFRSVVEIPYFAPDRRNIES